MMAIVLLVDDGDAAAVRHGHNLVQTAPDNNEPLHWLINDGGVAVAAHPARALPANSTFITHTSVPICSAVADGVPVGPEVAICGPEVAICGPGMAKQSDSG